jgi:hypothetical protein
MEGMDRIITIGKVKISLPSLVMVVAGIIVSLIVSLSVNVWFGLGLLPVFLLSAYNVNCSIVGHCVLWAWVLVSIFLLQLLSYIMIIMMSSKKDLKRLFSKK